MSDTGGKKLCFVIGPIGKDGSDERGHADRFIELVVRPTLQDDYRVERADDSRDPGMITSRMISDVINADLVVADLTGRNPNAFYELGIRHSFRKPVVQMTADDNIPFDNQDYLTIKYSLKTKPDWKQARELLAEHVAAIGTPGYTITNPVVSALTYQDLRQSGNSADRAVGELMAEVQALRLEMSGLKGRLPLGHLTGAIVTPITNMSSSDLGRSWATASEANLRHNVLQGGWMEPHSVGSTFREEKKSNQ